MTEPSELEQASKHALWKQVKILLPVYLNIFLTGCSTGWLPNAVYLFQNDYYSRVLYRNVVFVACSAELGHLLTALHTEKLADRFGRKNVILTAGVLHFLSWQLSSLNSGEISFCFARFLVGIATGLVNETAFMYINEIASPENRSKLTKHCELIFYSGIAFQCLITLLLSSHMMLSYFTLIVATICFVYSTNIPETPQYLLSVSKTNQALDSLTVIRPGYTEADIESEFKNMKKLIESEQQLPHENPWLQFLELSGNRIPVIKSFVIILFSSASGWFVTLAFITTFLPRDATVPSITFFIITFITLKILPFYREKYSPRSLLMLGAVGLSIGNALFVFTGVTLCQIHITFLGVSMTAFVYPMFSKLNEELLPQPVKNLGDSISVIAQTIGNIISTLIFQNAFYRFDYNSKYSIFMTNSLIFLILVYFLMPKVQDEVLSEIRFGVDDNQTEQNTNNETQNEMPRERD